VRCPRFTCVSDGNPFLRFDERSKAGLIEGIAMTVHVRLPWLA
jgi:hypothetical protein